VVPAPVGAIWGTSQLTGPNQVTVNLFWDSVLVNQNGSPLTDLNGYMIMVSTSWVLDPQAWEGAMVSVTSCSVVVPFDPPGYIGIRTVDKSGNQSMDSPVVDVSRMKLIVVADDRKSRAELTMPMAQQLRASHSTSGGVGRFIVGHELISYYENSQVIRAISFRTYRGDNAALDQKFVFKDATMDMYLAYDVVEGQVVQGKGVSSSQFSVPGTEDLNLLGTGNRELGTYLGVPVMAADNLEKKLSMFWYNGTQWVKLGGEVDTVNQWVGIRTARMGAFQIKHAVQLGDLSLVQIYPRIITPNGDGANDVAIFQFGEGGLSGQSIKGEIFDIMGLKVSALKPGPDPESTLMWDGKTDNGGSVPAGIYIYQISVGGKTINGTLVVAR